MYGLLWFQIITNKNLIFQYRFGVSSANLTQYLLVLYLKNLIGFSGLFWIFFAILIVPFILIITVSLDRDWKKAHLELAEKEKKKESLKI